MGLSKEDIRGKVVVVTGASSGNGKAMALLLARRGARLVLAARRTELLEATALEAESLGAEALAVSCDVTVREQVEAAAGAALERFGRIDAWINNAGVIAWSLFEDTTEEEFRRTLEVNLMGAVYGSWAALPAMRRQGSGVIVNIASTAALVALPVGSAYSSSKAALFAFGDSLRRELKGSGIRVCQVLPVGVNTAGFFHQRTRGFRLSRRIAFLLQDPETVARGVVRCVERPGTRNLPLGLQGKAALAAGALAPRLVDLFGGLVAGLVRKDGRAASPHDNLFSPGLAGHDIRGEGHRSDYDPTPYLEELPVPEVADDADAAPLGQRLAARDELGPDGVTTVKTARGTLAVGISGGKPFAVSNACRHWLAALGCGRVLSDGSLQCPWHRARYDVRTGEMVSGPEGRVVGFEPYSKAVEAYANLTPLRLERYPVVEKDGVIYLRADVATGPPGEVGGGRRFPPPGNPLS
jgi:NAD(P)-dependent dehydrogenase (short-subunit alcohol dehydrogenase family)/nitrite reductase/ring-hydroxylating ferredoxin subunit